jgi:hypothetical protein
VCAVLMSPSPAPATDNCPPLPISTSAATCKCSVQNYGTGADAGVKITLFTNTGSPVTCSEGPVSVPAKNSLSCTSFFEETDTCGCQVTGEGASTRSSLSLLDGNGNTVASVQCN